MIVKSGQIKKISEISSEAQIGKLVIVNCLVCKDASKHSAIRLIIGLTNAHQYLNYTKIIQVKSELVVLTIH